MLHLFVIVSFLSFLLIYKMMVYLDWIKLFILN